jgi:hypothetical protein
MAKAVKRVGRPTKPAVGASRVSLGLKVTASTKRVIEALALASGRTQSQECEFLLERALQYDEAMKSTRTTLESIEANGIEQVLARKGWLLVRMRDEHEKPAYLWAPPGHPWNPRSGFLSDDELNAWKPAGVSSEKAEEKQSKPGPPRKVAGE